MVTDQAVIDQFCPGDSSEAQNCNTKKCPEWAEWGEWGDCDADCNGGERERTRDCTDAAKFGVHFSQISRYFENFLLFLEQIKHKILPNTSIVHISKR